MPRISSSIAFFCYTNLHGRQYRLQYTVEVLTKLLKIKKSEPIRMQTRSLYPSFLIFLYPGPEFFLGLAYAKCEKTREEKGKTSGEFVSDSWFG